LVRLPESTIHMVRPRPATPPLLPYTTLFRSDGPAVLLPLPADRRPGQLRFQRRPQVVRGDALHRIEADPDRRGAAGRTGARHGRSEEHTSELQSRENLVCRLLLETKNTSVPS